MKTAIAAAAALLLTGAAQAHSVQWTGTLAPEVVGATGTGTMFLEFDTDTNELLIQTTFSGLSGNVTVAHIHCCTTNPNAGTAGVAILAPSLPGFPVGGTFGTYSRLFDLDEASSWSASFITASGGTPQLATARLINAFNAGTAYLNIHSTTFGGGEIRAFPVPEPGTWAMMALGLAAVGAVARKRTGR
jgi:hypothetical protein